MRAFVNDKKFLGIIGLPRQGTTLISGIMNTFENSFCSVEPHWSRILGKRESSGSKIPGNIMIGDIDGFVAELKNLLVSDKNFDIGAVKETYRSHQEDSCRFLLNSSLIDSYIFIFREPKSGFNSWKKTKWGGYYNSIDNYIKDYEKLFKIYERLKSSGLSISITYESLCNSNTSLYLNEKFRKIGINIPDNMESINYLGSSLGDPIASNGGNINPSYGDFSLLTEDEIHRASELDEIYKKLD